MGCTSSAPNMTDSQVCTTDDLDENNVTNVEAGSEKTEGNKNANILHESLQKKVIPGREINSNETQLVRTNITATFGDNNSNKSSTDVEDTSHSTFINDTINNSEPSKLDDSLTSLKDVVEKVISENNIEDEIKIHNIEETQEVDRQIEEIMESNDSDDLMDTAREEQENKDSTSPTQSEDSRATRWEALADIAAELPPSLAVDPLTGQIYSLTK